MGLNLKEFNKNIINWYELVKDSKVLLIKVNSDTNIENYLNTKVSLVVNENENISNINEQFDYIIIYGFECGLKIELKQLIDILKQTGKLLIIGNNDYGIRNWSKYNYLQNGGVLELEKDNKKESQIKNIKDILKESGITNTNTFYVFPNYEMAEIILNETTKIDRGYIEKYTPDIISDEIRVFDEIKVLKSIVKNSPQMTEFFANSYLIEVSKEQINSDIKYVSFNNVRKPKYRLMTILKENIVQKLPASKEAAEHMDNLKNNIEILKDKIELLDYEENGKVYSKLIKDNKTLDRILYRKHENLEEVVQILNDLKIILMKDSCKYNEEILKYLPEGTEKYQEILPELHYLENAFWDMVPKNCFYIEGKYVFFDQEWNQKYLPAEFILYRGIINSYDLVRNINVNELYERLKISKYIEFFEVLDASIRKDIIDKEVYDKIYPNIEIKAINNLINENKIYKENDEKQNIYIRNLEEQLNSYKEDNKNKQEYIEKLEKNQRKFFKNR